MYKSKMFELINDEINFLIESRPKNTLELKKIEIKELKKIEIKGFKVKLVFLDKSIMKVKTMNYEFDWLVSPKLIFKRDYLKPYKDKYFR